MRIKNLKDSSIILIISIIISKIIGLLRDVVLANYFGASSISDAYLITCSVPVLLFYFIGHAISTAFLPIYNKIRTEKNESEALIYSNNLLNISLIFCTILVIVLLAFPITLINVFAPGFDSQTKELTAIFFRICAVSLYFMTIVSIWTGYLQAKNNFVIPGIVSIPRNVMIILSIIIAAKVNIYFLGIGLLFAYIAETIFLLPFVLKNNYKYKFTLQLNCSYLKDTYALIIPIILGTAVSQINKIIDKSIASYVIDGGVSVLSYASVINTAIQEILVSSIITILFAECSKLIAQNRINEVKKKTNDTIVFLITILIPATIGVIILSKEIVSVLLLRGSFDADALNKTSNALSFYILGICFLAIRDVFIKVLYAFKLTKAPTTVSIISIIINIVLNLLLIKPFGLNGLALATSFAAIFQCIVMLFIVQKKLKLLDIRKILINLIKTLLVTLIMALVVCLLLKKINNLPDIIRLIILISTGLIVYFLVGYIFKLETLMLVVNVFKLKFKKKNEV